MKATASKNVKFVSGNKLVKGESYEILPPPRENPSRSMIIFDMDHQSYVNTTCLGTYFDQFKHVTISELAKATANGICQSMTGQDVEPDGWDRHGFPSMLLAMEMI